MVEQVGLLPHPAVGSDQVESQTSTRWLLVAVSLLAAYAAWRFPFWLRHSDWDLDAAFLPWLSHILQEGRLRALESSFADYNPPYIYALSASSLLARFVSPIAVVKLTNLPFLILSSAIVFLTCRRLSFSTQRAALGAALVLVAPETMQNIWSWGQCDMIYSSFLLAFVAAVQLKRPTLGVVCFAVALSFKLQAIFIGPFLLALVLAGEVPLWTLILIPVVYAAMLIPAIAAGRPPTQLLFVYGAQYNYFRRIAFAVPNPYILIVHWARTNEIADRITHIGLVFAAICNCGFLLYLWRRRAVLRTPTGVAIVAALAIMLEVYVLPKMHERYFFPANLIILMLVAFNPGRFWIPAVFVQLSSLICYAPFTYGARVTTLRFVPPVLMTTAAMWLLAKELERIYRQPDAYGNSITARL
jgi:Gpi18-like mannosyltransferase